MSGETAACQKTLTALDDDDVRQSAAADVDVSQRELNSFGKAAGFPPARITNPQICADHKHAGTTERLFLRKVTVAKVDFTHKCVFLLDTQP